MQLVWQRWSTLSERCACIWSMRIPSFSCWVTTRTKPRFKEACWDYRSAGNMNSIRDHITIIVLVCCHCQRKSAEIAKEYWSVIQLTVVCPDSVGVVSPDERDVSVTFVAKLNRNKVEWMGQGNRQKIFIFLLLNGHCKLLPVRLKQRRKRKWEWIEKGRPALESTSSVCIQYFSKVEEI